MTPRVPRFLIALAALSISQLSIAQVPADIQLVPAFGGETFSAPIGVRHANDGSGRKFIIERSGRIIIVDSNDTVLPTPFLDITAEVDTTFEGGFLGMAFHPDYASNGRFYVKYTFDEPGGGTDLITRVEEYLVSANPDIADASSARVIIEIPQDSNNHNGGDIHFGADGYLYFGMGDGGGGNDPCERGQGLDPDVTPNFGCATGPRGWLLGKMIRIDIDSTTPAGSNNLCAANPDGSAQYAIPADNPFLGPANRCAEVWAYGLRNPFRFSFDRDTGDLWIGDVGQSTWEEISVEAAGDGGGNNYGWKVCEANFLRGSTSSACNLSGHFGPVIEYRRNAGNCSVTGGYRYRGPITSMQGYYVYSDFCAGDVRFSREASPGNWVLDGSRGFVSSPAGFGEDEEGNLYVVSIGGPIFVFTGDVPSDGIFDDRFED